MTRAEKRAIKNQIRNAIKEFLRIQAHYFPDLIEDIKNIMDERNQSYVTYEIEVIIFVMILKNICSIESMQEMNETFNEDTCVKNIYRVLGLEEKNYLPHYVTINECLSRLDNKELEKVRKKMIYGIIRKRSFEYGKFLGEKWLVIVDAMPEDMYWTLSQLVNRRANLKTHHIRLKNQLHEQVCVAYPSYKQFFQDIGRPTALYFWEHYPSPRLLRGKTVEELAEELIPVSHNQFSTRKCPDDTGCG